jgi:DNA-binding Lrp family transcriptional regulator
MKQYSLRPADVAVALALCLEENQSYPRLAQAVGISLGEAHNAVRRLTRAKLISLTGRRPIRPALAEYLTSGVPYSFPAEIGPDTRGVATAGAAESPGRARSSTPVMVWPSSEGTLRGQSVTPLYPGATSLPERNPRLYQMLALVDCIRTGQSRERKRAKELLTRQILAAPGA